MMYSIQTGIVTKGLVFRENELEQAVLQTHNNQQSENVFVKFLYVHVRTSLYTKSTSVV